MTAETRTALDVGISALERLIHRFRRLMEFNGHGPGAIDEAVISEKSALEMMKRAVDAEAAKEPKP